MISVDDHLELPAETKRKGKSFYHHFTVFMLANIEPTPIENHSFGNNIIHGTHNLCENIKEREKFLMIIFNVYYSKLGHHLPLDTSNLPYV